MCSEIPLSHGEQDAGPAAALYDPGEQLVHSVAPGLLLTQRQVGIFDYAIKVCHPLQQNF